MAIVEKDEELFRNIVKVEKVNNGFVISNDEGTTVIEEDESKERDCKSIKRMLYEVLEKIGEYGSKHDLERVRIIVVDQNEKEIE